MLLHMVAPHGPAIFVGFQPATPSPLTPSGPVTITTNGQIVEDLDITATGGANGVTVNSGVTSWIARRNRIRHATGGFGIQINSGANSGTIEDCDIEHADWESLGAYVAHATSSNNNINATSAANLTVTRVRLTGGTSGILLQSCNDATLTFLEGHHLRGAIPRGQLVQLGDCNDALIEDFSVINDVLSDRTNDLINLFDCRRITLRRGLLKGVTWPTGTGLLSEVDGSADILAEDVDLVDTHSGGCYNFDAVAVGQSHGFIMRRIRVRDLRSLDCRAFGALEGPAECGGTCYPASANISTTTCLPTTSALYWHGGGVNPPPTTTLFDTCKYHYLPSDNGGLPLALIWPEGAHLSYVTDKATDLAFEDFVPRAAISLTMPWE